MPQGRSPISDLARMYGERIPTAPKSIGRLGPVSLGRGGLSMNPMPALRSVVRFVRNQPGTQVSTPINTGRGVSMGGQGGASQLVFDPAARAVERAVGDITAIPGVGKPSPSYTAEQIRQQGVVPGVLGAAMDYSMFVPAVGAGVRAGRNAMRGATADAAERLAQSMASREMGIGPTSNLPSQPFGFRTGHKKWWDVAKHANYEVNELGNNFPDVSPYSQHEGIWVTHTPEDALRYGDDIYEVDLSNATPIHADSDGGFFYVRPTTPAAIPERPVIPAQPFARATPEGNISIVSGAGEEVLRPIPPSTQRPSWMAPEPTPSLSQRDMDLLRYNPLEQSATPDQLARNFETMSRGRNPVTRNVDWSAVDPANDVDLTRVYSNELDAQMASPDAGTLWTAQKAAKDSVVDFLIRNGLQSELIQAAPSYVNLRTLPNYIATQDWPSLMRAVPSLKDHYVGVLRTYGIGF